MRLDILVKKEQDYYVAHCLQFDLVATDETKEGVRKAIAELCEAHIEFSLKNNHTEYLFSPAPKEVWAEYYTAMNRANGVFSSEEMIPPFMAQDVLCDDEGQLSQAPRKFGGLLPPDPPANH